MRASSTPSLTAAHKQFVFFLILKVFVVVVDVAFLIILVVRPIVVVFVGFSFRTAELGLRIDHRR